MAVRDTSIDPRLLASAREEFKKQGFIKADLKTICENAGVTTGAVYKRYKGKEELFCAVVQEALDTMSAYVGGRTEIEVTKMSDAELRNSWQMREEYMLELFRTLWKVREAFVLLLEKSAGTKYENYRHESAIHMTEMNMDYYRELQKRGMVKGDITRAEMHVLCSSFWTAICEPFVHKMPWKEIEEHCRILCRYFDWSKAVGLE
ncbi:MAG: TetR/AcrR family transcriptional regulator [Lachnospiraceae bacterium]|nr:TetR/AcrR family transcriptional regulator [Lachnospiraceae bacterium]MBR6848750.1 TetR/AcrR family transcriptional regulator [Lachnospiraceae bacterium]